MATLSALCVRKACHRLVLSLALGGFTGVSAQAAERAPTEEDYFAHVPVVLTASRLDQPLNEAPGAITVIDRHTIRLSGARTLVEVMRLVPGYLAGGWNGANPLASYHIPIDDYGTRNLVLIDGRSVYATSYLGDTHRGMMDVMLEDIERIEVLRGANSAAYGANAMFGVINIITRHSADTVGGELSVSTGDNGIRDRRARIGVGDETASFRLSIGEQRDSGYLNAYDDRRLGQVNLRADFQPTMFDEVMVAMGVSYLDAGEGFSPTDDGNPFHTIRTRDAYWMAEWRRQLNDTDEIKVSANYMEDRKWDYATSPAVNKDDEPPYAPGELALWDYNSVGRRASLELQGTFSLTAGLRALLGLGHQGEQARSRGLYDSQKWVSVRESRAFGALEWRASPQWLVNAGLFAGQHSEAGTYHSPRLMVSWLALPGHTFRAGVTESERTPNLYEYFGSTRIFTSTGRLYDTETAATGNVKPESLKSKELGYTGRFPAQNLTLDLRVYDEDMHDYIRKSRGDYINRTDLNLVGAEYQIRWRPWVSTEFWLNQSFSRLKWGWPSYERNDERRPPEHTTLIGWFQRLPWEVQLSVIHERTGGMTFRDNRDWMPFSHRTDVRLAYPFRIGTSKAEAAFTVQSVEGDRPFFLVRRNFELARKSFLTLRVEM